jgi:hypothetical protein
MLSSRLRLISGWPESFPRQAMPDRNFHFAPSADFRKNPVYRSASAASIRQENKTIDL